LTRDDKNLILRSEKLLLIHNFELKKTIERFDLSGAGRSKSLIINDGDYLLIANKNGQLTLFNLKNYKIESVHKEIIGISNCGKFLKQIHCKFDVI